MKSLAKAESLIRSLSDELKPRLEQNAAVANRLDTIRADRDSDGNPMLFLSNAGNEAAGQPVIAIRISQIDMVSKDAFGNANLAYAPHKCEIAWELDAANPEPSGLDIAIATAELAKTGVALQVKEIADATAVTAASMTAAAVAQEIDWQRWPGKSV